MPKQLSFKTIIIPLIISIDKTVFTQRHKNTSTWLMYLTIGNFNCAVQQKQAQLGAVLIEFIPIMPLKNYKNIKIILWHKALLIILKHKYRINFIIC